MNNVSEKLAEKITAHCVQNLFLKIVPFLRLCGNIW
jgi:hypothetical protein